MIKYRVGIYNYFTDKQEDRIIEITQEQLDAAGGSHWSAIQSTLKNEEHIIYVSLIAWN